MYQSFAFSKEQLTPEYDKSPQRDSNPRPPDYKSGALPTELWRHKYRCKSVHGVKIEGDLDKVADEIYALFCSLIKHFIENRIIPTSDVLDTMFPVIETEYTCPHCKKEIR